MTFVGKILVFMIMILSLMFMTFAMAVYSTHTNWRNEVKGPAADGSPGLEGVLQNRTKERDDLNNLVASLQTQLEEERRNHQAAYTKVINELYGDQQAGIPGVKQKLEQLEAQRNQLDEQRRSEMQTLADNQAQLDSMTKELEAVRLELSEASRARDAAFEQLTVAQADLGKIRGELGRLQDREVQLTEQINKQRQLIAYHGLLDQDNGQKPPRVEGRILGLNASRKLVEISIGSDDGILPGHELKVFRTGDQPRFLGLVRVQTVDPDRAVAQVVPGSQRGAIERDDRVATELR